MLKLINRILAAIFLILMVLSVLFFIISPNLFQVDGLTVDIERPGICRTIGNTTLLNHSYKSKSICLDVDNTIFINRFAKGVYQVLNNAPSQ